MGDFFQGGGAKVATAFAISFASYGASGGRLIKKSRKQGAIDNGSRIDRQIGDQPNPLIL